MDLSSRGDLSEQMDEMSSYEDIRNVFSDLSQVNLVTFGYRPTLTWLSQLNLKPRERIHIVDVGCGRGDMLRQVGKWAVQRNIEVTLTGVDINPYAARVGQEMSTENQVIHWFTGDIFSFRSSEPVDIVISSLFTHHLDDARVVKFLRWMEITATRGWFINDLHRQRMFIGVYRVLSAVMRWHPVVKSDGQISIRRSFRAEDWRDLCRKAQLDLFSIQIKRYSPGRLCVGRIK